MHSKSEATPRQAKLAISQEGCGDFPVPLRYASVAVPQGTAPSASLADTGKSPATRAGGIFEMGSGSWRPIAAGAVWGLALGVKLIAVVFLGPVLIAYYLARGRKDKNNIVVEKSAGRKFFLMGIAVLLVVASLNLFFFSTSDRLHALESMGMNYKGLAPSSTKASLLAFAGSTLADAALSVSNYLDGPPHPLGSPWYMWPAMQIPVPLYSEGAASITLQGNYVIWLAATLAVAIGFALSYRYLRGYLRSENPSAHSARPFFLLLGGYIGSLLPFFTIVRRSTFLYHYFPALIFAIGLLAWLVARALKLDNFDTLNKKQILALAVIVVATIGGFLWTAPVTYGLAL